MFNFSLIDFRFAKIDIHDHITGIHCDSNAEVDENGLKIIAILGSKYESNYDPDNNHK